MTFHTDRGNWRADPVNAVAGSATIRANRGRRACLAGAMAEDGVARHLEARGMRVIARRWRGRAGEIDLILRDGACVVFVEVKQAATHAEAGLRLRRPQMDRICAAASEYCGTLPQGLLTEMRLDVALVDAAGRIEMIDNAFAEA